MRKIAYTRDSRHMTNAEAGLSDRHREFPSRFMRIFAFMSLLRESIAKDMFGFDIISAITQAK